MANQNLDNAAYMVFIENLNQILVDVDIHRLNYF